MSEAIDSVVPSLPIDHAAEALLQVNPTLGAIIIFEAAAICVLSWFILRLVNKLEAARSAHIEDLKLTIPTMRDLRETIMAEVQHRRSRS